MIKTGWWHIRFDLTLEGEEIRWDDLDECTQEHIVKCIKEGYTSGEIVMEEDCEEDCIGMTLEDFSDTNIFFYADIIDIYINGTEVDIPDDEWKNYKVVSCHKSDCVGIVMVDVIRI